MSQDIPQATMIKISKLKKYFSISRKQIVHAVDDVSFEIKQHEIVGLVGESGSGKSTLGKTIVGLLDKTAGEIHFKDHKLPAVYKPEHFKKYSQEIQMIFQDPYASLNPRMTVEEIVSEGLKLRGETAKQHVTEKVVEWLENVGLNASFLPRYPHEFSGGQRQRIGIARAMIIEPEFVVCDEPISAQDVSVQAQIINLLEKLKNTMGLTLLFIAHDLSMVRYISDRMAVMYLGKVVEIGPANDVYFRAKHPYTEFLIAANPEPDPELEKNKLRYTIPGEIPSPINVKPGCRFASRCPKRMPECETQTPVLKTIANNHQVACHLY